MGNLLEKWNEYIVQGNQLSRELEEFEGIMHAADKPESVIAFYGPAGSGTTFIDSVLSPEKMAEIKSLVVASLTEARLTKEIELEKLMGIRKPATINPEFEAAVQGMVESSKKTTGRKTIEFDIDQVRDMYINQGMSYKGIAEKLKCSDFTVRKFCNNNGIVRDAVPVEKPVEKQGYPVMTVEAVRKIYTDGTMSLADAAKHFGVASGELYTYIEKHGLKRQVVKPNDPFRDAHKMGKDEFKSKLLSSRK